MSSNFEITVNSIYTDNFALWNLGEFDYLDSIQTLQDGIRKRFPLKYNGTLLSFEIDSLDPQSSLIDPQTLLMIFVNGIFTAVHH